ncbi:23S rRNA (pseudouridine(1915)-N(3))-methyltransferase RlmH [Campylobacter sp. LR196d]|nr:23S rRNA (pseudouridine(1915)-N(3))-methyltransferase RlmH [Campylobacter sp. LR196d]KAA6226698.1 23S rRNA (pseudouridine(1915)-N(3))-methyltransferase RlmH [Campylobacter sp. LR286c]
MENNLQINIYFIQKNEEFKAYFDKYIKLISKYATLKEFNLFNNKIANAQNIGKEQAQKSYEQAFNPYLKKGFCIGLDENGKSLTSLEFAKLLKDKSLLNFFIGGAFGFNKNFIKNFDLTLSLSNFTLAHNIARLFLLEQLYRTCCINNNHPYHK